MVKPTFINGKANLDYCYLCNESKEAIKYSQRNTKSPIYCGAVDYFGECLWEADRHVFVITEKSYKDDIQSENDWFVANGEEIDEKGNMILPWEDK